MLVFRTFTDIYNNYMMVFTIHAGIYDPCWYLRSMLVFTIHAGIYDPCWYLRSMLIFKMHAGIYDPCWYLRSMLVFALHACIVTLLAGIYAASWHSANWSKYGLNYIRGLLSIRYCIRVIRKQGPYTYSSDFRLLLGKGLRKVCESTSESTDKTEADAMRK